jgi:hypothetical protein
MLLSDDNFVGVCQVVFRYLPKRALLLRVNDCGSKLIYDNTFRNCSRELLVFLQRLTVFCPFLTEGIAYRDHVILACFVFGRPSNLFGPGYHSENAFRGKFRRRILYTGCDGPEGLLPSITPFRTKKPFPTI